MKGTSFYSVKGGSGCSTVAACFAIESARDRETVIRSRQPQDMTAVLGLPAVMDEASFDAFEVFPGLTLGPWKYRVGDVATVYDFGLEPDPAELPEDRKFLVLRADYLSLRRAITSPVEPTGIVLVGDAIDKALQRQDVEDVVGVKVVASVPWSSQLGTAIDAGLLSRRVPSGAAKAIRPLLAGVTP